VRMGHCTMREGGGTGDALKELGSFGGLRDNMFNVTLPL